MKKLLGALTVAVFAAACSDQGPDDHHEPFGVEIRDGSTVVVRIFGNSVTGQITVEVGEETPNYTFVFLDDDDDPIELDSDEFLDVQVANESIAEFDHVNRFTGIGHFEGVAEGSTTATVRLMHGAVGSAHADYISPAIPVVVTP